MKGLDRMPNEEQGKIARWDLRDLQKEHAPWSLHNFGEHTSNQPARGIIEEFGELFEAKDYFDAKDAIGDILIFAADYCNTRKWDLQDLFDDAAKESKILSLTGSHELPYFRTLVARLGRFAHSDLKAEQNIRRSVEKNEQMGKHSLVHLLAYLFIEGKRVGLDNSIEIIDYARGVWEVVKQRDWKKSALTGGQ